MHLAAISIVVLMQEQDAATGNTNRLVIGSSESIAQKSLDESRGFFVG